MLWGGPLWAWGVILPTISISLLPPLAPVDYCGNVVETSLLTKYICFSLLSLGSCIFSGPPWGPLFCGQAIDWVWNQISTVDMSNLSSAWVTRWQMSPLDFGENWDQHLELWMRAGIWICLDFLLAVDDAWCGDGHMSCYLKDTSSFSVGSLLVVEAHWAWEMKYKTGKVEEKCLCSGA